jgi:hypothetical protein
MKGCTADVDTPMMLEDGVQEYSIILERHFVQQEILDNERLILESELAIF